MDLQNRSCLFVHRVLLMRHQLIGLGWHLRLLILTKMMYNEAHKLHVGHPSSILPSTWPCSVKKKKTRFGKIKKGVALQTRFVRTIMGKHVHLPVQPCSCYDNRNKTAVQNTVISASVDMVLALPGDSWWLTMACFQRFLFGGFLGSQLAAYCQISRNVSMVGKRKYFFSYQTTEGGVGFKKIRYIHIGCISLSVGWQLIWTSIYICSKPLYLRCWRQTTEDDPYFLNLLGRAFQRHLLSYFWEKNVGLDGQSNAGQWWQQN